MRALLVVGMMAALSVPGALGQAQDPEIYEVATVRPSAPTETSGFSQWSSVRFSARGQTLQQLIKTAYDIRTNAQLSHLPQWAETERFDVEAKITAAQAERLEKVPIAERFQTYLSMLRSLLEDRFGLKVHEESMAVPTEALVIAKGGPKLPDTSGLSPSDGRVPPSKTAPPAGRTPPHIHIGPGHFEATALPMSSFVEWVARQPEVDHRVVVDRTGLTGTYGFNLHWSPDSLLAQADSSGGAPDLRNALQEQLGLQLVHAKEDAKVRVIVVEHAERPSEN